MNALEYLSSYLDEAWEYVKNNFIIKKISQYQIGYQGNIKIVCISDTHSNNLLLMNIPEADILIHTGDFTKFGTYQEIIDFNDQIGKFPHKYKIVIAGNHDIILDDNYYNKYLSKIDIFNRGDQSIKKLLSNCIYLEDNSVTLYGFKFYGSPYQPYFKNLGFNVERGNKLKEIWDKIPNDTDVLLTHSPPFGYGDFAFYSNQHVGCVDLLQRVNQIKPKYHIFGHIHEGYGVYTDLHTIFINCSSCDTENCLDNTKRPIIIYL